ncbi:MAG: hypothetical protein HY210_00500 [Candidatus Omnitrophica bacterium]|nr:hypothetical protein [Candidatus Omnitrophota bacterium]
MEKGRKLHRKYGKFIDGETLLNILEDREFVRFPARIVFDSSKIENGMFALAQRVSRNPSDGYIIFVHEYFKTRQGDLPAVVFYHLVTVNYGDFAACSEAEEFGSAALGLDKEYYYQYLCRLADQIPG